MLTQLDPGLKLEKSLYREFIKPLRQKLVEVQRRVNASTRPVLILFDGFEACGKGDSISQLATPMDPRGFKVHLLPPTLTEDEAMRPPLWRFWLRIPARGEIVLFDRSHYMPLIEDQVHGTIDEPTWNRRRESINSFERQLVDDGTILIKFWMHIDAKEQRKRFRRIEKSPYESWRISKNDWKMNRRYDEYFVSADRLLTETDTPHAPWTLVSANDKRHRRVQILRTITETLDCALANDSTPVTTVAHTPTPHELDDEHSPTLFDRVDLSRSLSREDYESQLDAAQKRLRELEFVCYKHRAPVVIVYQGWDAAGKGGNIKRLTQRMDPRGYNVIPIAAPTGDEATHHYLWRFWRHIPKAGHFAIFDRSWYGRVLVERIEGFCREDEWKRAYHEINEFERQLANFGTVIVKFWIHISPEEQLRRFEDRQNTPAKQWKLTDEDWRNRDKWSVYKQAAAEMIERTTTNYAPWTVVEGNCKLWARVRALNTVIQAIEDQIPMKKK